MEELDKLQAEIRGIDVSKLSEKEYENYKIKVARIQTLIKQLYD